MRHANASQISAGDVVRYKSGTWDHTIFVLGVNGNIVSYADCNGSGKNDSAIVWSRTITTEILAGKISVPLSQYPSQKGYIAHNVRNELTNQFIDGLVFNASFYYYRNSDLQSRYTIGGNIDVGGLQSHWLNYGLKEGRVASPFFDVKYYLKNNADLQGVYNTDYVGATSHYLNYGRAENRKSSLIYDPHAYRQCNADLANMNYEELLIHYRLYGIEEGRRASKEFDIKSYLIKNPDVAANTSGNCHAVFHALSSGVVEGRDLTPIFYVEAIPSQVFHGGLVEPNVTVKDNDFTLLINTDYTVSYRNNTARGTGEAIITGKGIYSGSITVNFAIV